jgi:hypothetical protein
MTDDDRDFPRGESKESGAQTLIPEHGELPG